MRASNRAKGLLMTLALLMLATAWSAEASLSYAIAGNRALSGTEAAALVGGTNTNEICEATASGTCPGPGSPIIGQDYCGFTIWVPSLPPGSSIPMVFCNNNLTNYCKSCMNGGANKVCYSSVIPNPKLWCDSNQGNNCGASTYANCTLVSGFCSCVGPISTPYTAGWGCPIGDCAGGIYP